ncbi:DinB family protein [Kribbella sp. NPDC048915]|uniref:DinB family protein n=1 Tax=Kribbella sp. NPDC048915 TaxID=3155148 RepID=UPI0034024123
MRTATTTPAQAVELIRRDQDLLLGRTEGLTEAELRAPYDVTAGPLGDFCDSLHDLVAHVLMWDEITLAVLRDARAGHLHWSLDPRWETPDIGRAMNLGGVEAGRRIPSELVLHRFRGVGAALLDEIAQYDEDTWADPSTGAGFDGGIGALAEYVSTTPDGVLFAHAARHLGLINV